MAIEGFMECSKENVSISLRKWYAESCRVNDQYDEKPLIHSDRGCHYRWSGWVERMEEAGLKRSMSKKGCSPDNAACEGLFGRLKNEMFYNRDWRGVSIPEFITTLNEYLVWYNEKRIKVSLGNMSPVEYRRSLRLNT